MEVNNFMKIGVLTDSSSYLTKEQCEKYGIDVLGQKRISRLN